MPVYRRHFKSMIITVKLSMGCIQTYEKYPELFGKNAFLGIFSQDMNKNISSLPKKAFAICLSLSQASRFTTFLFGHAQKSKFHFFFRLSFFPLLIFLLQWSTLYWACFQFNNSGESIIEAGNVYHGVAKGNFPQFFTEISGHFRAYFRLN